MMTNDNLDPIEKRLKRYYERQTLPLDVLMELEETVEQNPVSQNSALLNSPLLNPVSRTLVSLNPEWRWFSVRMKPLARLAAIAAVFLLTISLGYFLTERQANSHSLESVAAEIALNHAKQFDSEFFPSNIPVLVHSMALLDFAPVHPRRLQLGQYQINGARYCTIDSSIAVQVRLQDEAQQDYTLYEFRGPDWLVIEDEEVLSVGEIQVTLWQEGGVTMGLAQRVNQF